jgi:hypothetical protein
MSCVVGIVDKKSKKIFLGGDSAIIGGCSLDIRKSKKVFIKDDFIVGVCGSPRLLQLMEHGVEYKLPGTIKSNKEVEGFVVLEFVDKLRKCLRDHGALREEFEVETIDGVILLGIKGCLFKIGWDLLAEQSAKDYNAIGCGDDYAKGCLFALRDKKYHPKFRINMALDAASEFSAAVAPPFHVLEMGY